jgi:hypothetical protein
MLHNEDHPTRQQILELNSKPSPEIAPDLEAQIWISGSVKVCGADIGGVITANQSTHGRDLPTVAKGET